jgi:hypothetical protein
MAIYLNFIALICPQTDTMHSARGLEVMERFGLSTVHSAWGVEVMGRFEWSTVHLARRVDIMGRFGVHSAFC